jgi:hypothetical protein
VDVSTLTGAACVRRLTELGFAIVRTSLGMTLLGKRTRRVIVPHVTIEPKMLHAILSSAGVSEAEFLGNPARSGVYTKTTPPPSTGSRKTGG